MECMRRGSAAGRRRVIEDPLLSASRPSFAMEPLRAALVSCWKTTGILEPLGGERDRNFKLTRSDGSALLVKLSHPAEDPAIIDFENATLLHLEAMSPGLPVPRLVPTVNESVSVTHLCDDGRPCSMRVTTFLTGQPMSEEDSEAGGMRELGVASARLNRALIDFSHAADRRSLLWNLREASQLRELLAELPDDVVRRSAETALDRYEVDAAARFAAFDDQVIHNDLNPHNVLFDPVIRGRLTGIIDFGDILRAPRLHEIATACAYRVNAGPDPLWGTIQFLSGYQTIFPLTDDEIELLPVMISARMAMSLLIGGWRARREPENASYVLRNSGAVREGLETLLRSTELSARLREELVR
jgi:hydroxylysine kinase